MPRRTTPIGRQAFTLIELLVVIAIIGLLSTIAVVSLSSARSKARDTKRIASVKQIITAMQLYYETNGSAPNPNTLGCGNSANWYCLGHTSAESCWNGAYAGCNALNTALAPYMAKIPDDPSPGNYGAPGDAFLYNFGFNFTPQLPPVIHWGMENGPTTSSSCLNGGSGAWASGTYHDSQYWCVVSVIP
jgi:prepilin-type N-terminal cleavage/methylation domain-containing protein